MSSVLLQKLGIDLGDIFVPQTDGKYGVKIKVKETRVSFSKDEHTYHAQALPMDTLLTLISGGGTVETPLGLISTEDLGVSIIDDVKNKIINALSDLADATNSAVVPTASILSEDNDEDLGVSIYAPGASIDSGPTESPIPLRDAQHLYQPVYGTNSNSVYTVAALRDDLRMAVRVTPQKVSVRVEGDLAKHESALNDAGLSVKDGSNAYASVHLASNDIQLARRTIGAMIMALGVEWTTPVPDFIKLYKQGIG